VDVEVRDRKAMKARRERHRVSKWARAGNRRRSTAVALLQALKEVRGEGFWK